MENCESIDFEKMLAEADIRPTAMRILVLEALCGNNHKWLRAYSLSELEASLAHADKSSIFRALTVFLEHNIVHIVEDKSGQTKYALTTCGEHMHCQGPHLHAHFHCHICNHTYCLHIEPSSFPKLPEGFDADKVSYVAEGICPNCHKIK
ncbi:MAG: transcriptional repressor [Bacteroidales bacterium]|nr:transcriptional repressor [Bacteroidales bacterium]